MRRQTSSKGFIWPLLPSGLHHCCSFPAWKFSFHCVFIAHSAVIMEQLRWFLFRSLLVKKASLGFKKIKKINKKFVILYLKTNTRLAKAFLSTAIENALYIDVVTAHLNHITAPEYFSVAIDVTNSLAQRTAPINRVSICALTTKPHALGFQLNLNLLVALNKAIFILLLVQGKKKSKPNLI